jgi:AcrR family transcriptional regulator
MTQSAKSERFGCCSLVGRANFTPYRRTKRQEPCSEESLACSAPQESARDGTRKLAQLLRAQWFAAQRLAILTAAETAIGRQGLKLVKMVDIASNAGVAVGTLYRHFPGKRAIIEAIRDQLCQRLDELLRRPFDSSNPFQQLLQFVERACFFMDQNQDLWRLFEQWEAVRKDSTQPAHTTLQHAIFGRLTTETANILCRCSDEGMLRRDLPFEMLVWTLSTLLKSASNQWPDNPVRLPHGSKATIVVTLFLEGIRGKDGM